MSRRLDWPDCCNARDLGGLATTDGGRIRDGALVRSDSHFRLTEVGLAAVRAARISRVLDLRSPDECAAFPSPFAATAMYRNAPLLDVMAPERDDDPETLLGWYLLAVEHRRPAIARAVACVARAPEGGVAVHCFAGKDRTGLIVALVLAAVGVAPETIAADYALSAQCLAPVFEEELAAIDDPARREHLWQLQQSPPETILAALDHVDTRFGGVAAYLSSVGLTGSDLGALRDRLVVAAP